MSLLARLKSKLQYKQQESYKPLLNDEEATEIKAAIDTINAPVALEPKQPRGRVIKNTRQTEFNPVISRRGGRVVRAMPRELQKIKEAQEKPVEDD